MKIKNDFQGQKVNLEVKYDLQKIIRYCLIIGAVSFIAVAIVAAYFSTLWVGSEIIAPILSLIGQYWIYIFGGGVALGAISLAFKAGKVAGNLPTGNTQQPQQIHQHQQEQEQQKRISQPSTKVIEGKVTVFGSLPPKGSNLTKRK